MNPTQLIKALGNAGGEWVLYLLMLFSLVSISIILERLIYFWSNREPVERVIADGIAAMARGEHAAAGQQDRGAVGRLFQVAVEAWPLGPARLHATLLAHRLQEKAAAERGLVILGTLGNNAPFVGLFGTVLGIIKAFQDLGSAGAQGPSAVMTGISEALVATAVGILVAIPAVIAFNLGTRQIRLMDYRLEEAAEAIEAVALAEAGERTHARG